MQEVKISNGLDKKMKEYFCIFLLIHFVVWTLLCLVRHLLPVDAMEGIVWGSYLDFGTHKHPPLAGWISYFVYNIMGQKDISIYLIGQVCAILGFVYVYKLGKLFLNKHLALFSVMMLEGCFSYSYMSVFDGFNPNFLMFITFPAIAYYLYLALNRDLLKDWIFLGVFVGLSLLAKYQTILLVFAILVFILIYRNYLKCFKNYKLYVSIFIAFIINFPHLLWLIKQDFFSWAYFFKEQHTTLVDHFMVPTTFLLEQVFAILGVLFIFVFLYIKFKEKSFNNYFNLRDAIYILIIGFLPLLLQAFPSFITGERLIGTWGYPMLFMTSIALLYFYPVKVTNESFSLLTKSVYSVMTIIFLVLLTLFCVEKNFRSTYPYEIISNDFKEIFKKETGKELKYVSGYIEFALPITIYDVSHPQIIFDTYGHKNPWIDEEDLSKNGVLIVTRNEKSLYENLIPYTKDYVQEKYSVYQFTIKNKFNSPRKYNLYYKIVKPIE